MSFLEFLLGGAGILFSAMWCIVPVFVFFCELKESEKKPWYELSRRQKIAIGILAGPIFLVYTIFYIFIKDTGRFWKSLGNTGKNAAIEYFKLLK